MGGKDRLSLPILLDGATGTEYMKAGMPSGVCVEEWAAQHPEVVRDVARRYVQAGSDIVYAPTFLLTSGSLAKYGLGDKVRELNTCLVSIVKEAVAGCDVLVAGDMSTTGLMRKPFGDTDFTEFVDMYTEQSAALLEAGADIITIETMSSLSECRAAVFGARKTGLPIFLSMTVDAAGHTMWGDDILACMIVLQELGISAFGVNCSQGPSDMKPIFESLAPYAKLPLMAKPNAGEPPLTPVQFSDSCAALMRRGVSIVGGCCGTDHEYIAALRHMLDSFDIDGVKIKPEEYNLLAASRNVYYLDEDLEYSEPVVCAVDMADDLLDVAEEGCGAVLIRLDTHEDGYNFAMNSHMLDLPIAFESESIEALENALLHYPGRAIIVSTSCEIEKDDLRELAVRYGAILL